MPPLPMPSHASADPSGQPAPRCGFPRSARVRAKAEFDQVFQHGQRAGEALLALHWLEDARPARLGLAVSRKVDPDAVGRNRIKRALREGFRRLRQQLRPGAYVVVARAPAAQADGALLRAAFERRLRKLGALPPPLPLGTMPPAGMPDPTSQATEQTPP